MHRNLTRATLCLLSLLICAATAPAQGRSKKGQKGTGFAGRWSTMLGPVEFKQRGKKVTGKYGYENRKISGTAKGQSLDFEFKGGSGTITLWKDGQTFTGNYTWNGRDNAWGGYRIAAKVAKPAPGKITQGQSRSWLNYHLRVPKGFKKSKRYPAIAFFHGSNMSSSAYVNTIAIRWPKIAKRYILVGFDGEHLSPYAKEGRRAHNFTYVNFSGHEQGPKGMHRQSPALVAEALDELKTQLPITHWFAGGHSQGGYLTYTLLMFYPDKVRGVFPMSCGLIVQCEPSYSYFKKQGAEFVGKQKQVGVAIIHGENDGVVKFSSGQYGLWTMVDGGFPAARLFTSKTAAHMFAHLPVDKAVAWLEGITSTDTRELVSFAKKQVDGGHYRDASAALLRAEAVSGGKARSQTQALWAKIDKAAGKEAGQLAKAIKANRNGEWADGFLAFRQQFAFAPAAKDAMAAYANLRKKQAKKADAAFFKARGSRDKAARRKQWKEIVEKYYASKWYQHVKSWLEN